jgi:phosphatidylglycerol:prolipoprotein diacylglycerol transferase
MTYPQIDPVIFSIGPLHVRWYGLMYVLGFIATILLVKYQIKKFKFTELEKHFENLNLVLIISMVLGGRLGYVLFYNFSYYLQHPSYILATWQGGMSFHGGMLGLIIGGVVFCKKNKIEFWRAADMYAVTIPIGLGLGRLGNFINAELYRTATPSPIAALRDISRGPGAFSGFMVSQGKTKAATLLATWFHLRPFSHPIWCFPNNCRILP